MNQLLKWVLGPVLLWQGRKVRRETTKLPEPPGDRVGQVGHGPTLKLLILGDSAAAGVGTNHLKDSLLGHLLNQLAPNHSIEYRLHATSGHKIQDTVQALHQLPDQQFDLVVTVLGVNDVTSQVPLTKWVGLQQRLLEELQQKHQPGIIITSGLPPMGSFPVLPQPLRFYLGCCSRTLDEALIRLTSNQPKIQHLPMIKPQAGIAMASDGFHPSKQVYEMWAQGIVQILEQRGMLAAKVS